MTWERAGFFAFLLHIEQMPKHVQTFITFKRPRHNEGSYSFMKTTFVFLKYLMRSS